MHILLEFPLSVVQQTHLPCFEPAGEAVEVKKHGHRLPHATVHSSEVADARLAQHPMERSIMRFLQMAQL